MKYPSIAAVDNRLEKIIGGTVRHYLTDWTEYDKPKYEGLKASGAKEDKTMILIARTCGTYLFTLDQIENNTAIAQTYDYFFNYESANYYYIDLNRLEVKAIDPKQFQIKKAA